MDGWIFGGERGHDNMSGHDNLNPSTFMYHECEFIAQAVPWAQQDVYVHIMSNQRWTEIIPKCHALFLGASDYRSC